MKVYNYYIFSVALLLFLTTVLLTAFEEQYLEVYYTVFIIEALFLTELFSYLQVKARRALSAVSLVLIAGFALALVMEIVRVL